MGEKEAIEQARCALGRRLAHLRRSAGLSQPQLAPLTGYSRSTVANAEIGRQSVARDFWQRCDEVLATGGVLARDYDALDRLIERQREEAARAVQAERQARIDEWRARPFTTWQRQSGLEMSHSPELSLTRGDWSAAHSDDLAALLDEAAPGVTTSTMARLVHEWLVVEPPQRVELSAGRQIGENLVSKVERRVEQLRHMGDFLGGGDLYHLVGRELTVTGQLLRDAAYTESLGRRLLTAAGDLCQLTGWVAAGRMRELATAVRQSAF